MDKKISYFELKKEVVNKFQEAGIDEIADFDWICCEITGKKRSELPFIKEFNKEEMIAINKAVERRLKHIPLGYIFGKTEFYGREFVVSPDVLIPRIDTEVLVEKLIEDINLMQKDVSVLDIGTGSGAIAITLNKETGANVTAVDISINALEVARKNAEMNNAGIVFIQSDLFDSIPDLRVDIIVSNPPYIESGVIDGLMPEVRDNEPILALDGGEDGLNFYKKIISLAPKHLNKNGRLYFEIGYNQGELVSDLMKKEFKNIQIIKDYSGNDRVVMGELYD